MFAFYLSFLLSDICPAIPSVVFKDVLATYWHVEGREEAERDIAEGKLKWRIYGHLAGIDDRSKAFIRLMQNRYDVDVEVIAQCTVEYEAKKRADGYNERVRQELRARFGWGADDDGVERVRRDAAKWHQRWWARYGLLAALALLGVIVARVTVKRVAGGRRSE
jgi:hypothetical protein